MFQVITIKPNTFNDFKLSLWSERNKVKEYMNIVDTSNFQELLVDKILNPDKKPSIDLNTLDVLYTRTHTYQLVYNCESEEENYIGTVLNYKRKIVKGICVLVKISVNEIDSKLIYKESALSMDDVDFILKDLFFHTGYKISDKIEEFTYDNKYNITNDVDHIFNLNSHELNLFGIPIKIWYKEDTEVKTKLSYVRDIGIFLNKKINEVYITSAIYPQCKTLSLDNNIVKQIIDLVTTYPDEGELKDISVAYNFGNKEQRTHNVYIMFDDFYWKVVKQSE